MTLDPAYLKAYGVSDESVRREAQALQTLVADDPLQGLRAGHLALTVAATLREIDDTAEDGRHVRAGPALAMIRSMDEIRSQIDQMVDHERFRLANREARAEAFERRWTSAGRRRRCPRRRAGRSGAGARAARSETAKKGDRGERPAPERSCSSEISRSGACSMPTSSAIIIWEVEGRILEANDAFLRIVGYDREDLASGRLHRTDAHTAGMARLAIRIPWRN